MNSANLRKLASVKSYDFPVDSGIAHGSTLELVFDVRSRELLAISTWEDFDLGFRSSSSDFSKVF